MCGIFGYIGEKKDAPEIIFDGLKRLEYRGYDSWGIASKNNSKIYIEKHIGKIGDSSITLPDSNIGIGHTRWATHGAVTEENSHPHSDCHGKIAVVHNGIIENFQDLKNDLLDKGHKFKSETDTEVFAHLLEELGKSENDFHTVFRNSFLKLKGLNAILVINLENDEILAAKTGSPLIIGIGENELFIASDASGILTHTKKVVFLEDKQMAILGKELKILGLQTGSEEEFELNALDWEIEISEKGDFEHFLIKEIHEQPAIIRNIALNYSDQAKELAKLIESSRGAFLLGCGTASYAGLSGVYLFSNIAKRHINFSIGSEFEYSEEFIKSESLIIPISQSGETIDVIEPVIRAKEKGAKIASIVNVLGSTLYRNSDFKILLGAGIEKAVVATKSFTAMVSVLLLTSYALINKEQEAKELLFGTSKNIEEILNESIDSVKNLAEKLKDKEHIYVLGRGLSYAAALEVALKIKETTYIHAEGFAGGELKHGVITLIEKGTPVIIIAPNDETFDDIISNAQEVKARGGYIIGIGPRKSEVFDEFLKTEDLGKATIIPQIVISQLLSYYLALAKGIADPDKPRNLAKSVTVK